jgi:CHRD domain
VVRFNNKLEETSMHQVSKSAWRPLAAAVALALSAGFSGVAFGADVKVTLSGDQEVPPVKTEAKGSGTIAIGDDMSVKGSVMTTGITATAAHIHMGAAGKNGPVIVPLTKSGDTGWAVGAGAKLTDDQMKAFKAGDLYVNVHSAANPGGEIRGQLKP